MAGIQKTEKKKKKGGAVTSCLCYEFISALFRTKGPPVRACTGRERHLSVEGSDLFFPSCPSLHFPHETTVPPSDGLEELPVATLCRLFECVVFLYQRNEMCNHD